MSIDIERGPRLVYQVQMIFPILGQGVSLLRLMSAFLVAAWRLVVASKNCQSGLHCVLRLRGGGGSAEVRLDGGDDVGGSGGGSLLIQVLR